MSGNLKHIHFFICPHGFGHIRRVLKVIKVLLATDAAIHVNLHVQAKHLQSFQGLLPEWGVEKAMAARISWTTSTMTSCPDFSTPEYSADVYEQWLLEIQAGLNGHTDELVVSDNLVAPAFYAENAVLMGSFLWSSVVNEHYLPAYQHVKAHERALLEQRPFDMLALEDMAMSDVRNLTNMVTMPWFCDKHPSTTPENNMIRCRVLLSVGGTSKAVEKGLALLSALQSQTNVAWYLDKRLYDALPDKTDHIQPFDFSEAAFDKLDLIIARPGIGILTDCVAHGIPIIAIGETFNAELAHNAETAENKGWGWNWLEKEPSAMLSEFGNILQPEKLNGAKNRLALAASGGAQKAAGYLLSQLNLVRA